MSLRMLCVCFILAWDREFLLIAPLCGVTQQREHTGHVMRLILVVMQNVIPLLELKTLKELSEENRYKNVTTKCLTTS
jgi:hypothetical protein